MSNVKNPNWDKIIAPIITRNYDPKNTMPLINHVTPNMTAFAKLNNVTVRVCVQKVLSGNNIEGQIIQIDSAKETIKDLSKGDIVYIPQGLYHLSQDIKT